jgi:hypothetical protein
MKIALKDGHITSIKLVDGGREAAVIQFSKDPFGNVHVVGWCPGQTQLFDINVPAADAAIVDTQEAEMAVSV